jgi:hypothetical protein
MANRNEVMNLIAQKHQDVRRPHMAYSEKGFWRICITIQIRIR